MSAVTEPEPLLQLEGINTYYGQIHILAGLEPARSRRRARVPPRRQRIREVDDAEDDPRPRPASHRSSASRRRRRDADADGAPDPARARDRAGEPPAVRADDRPSEPRDGRVPSPESGPEGGVRARLLALPAPVRAPLAARGDTVGRRAADGRDGSRPDVEATAPPDGRAVDGSRADPRRAELRDHRAGQRLGRRDARRRAERQRFPLRSQIGATSSRPGGSCSRELPPPCSRTKGYGRHTLAVEATRVGAAIRGEFPIFETATYLNSCSQGALSNRVRAAVEDWLARVGRERRGVGLLGRAERGVPRARSPGC